MNRQLLSILAIAVGWLLVNTPATTHADSDHFLKRVAPILQRRCLSCHNDQQRKGDFSLQTRKSAFAEGYIEPGNAESSYLLEVVTAVDGKATMPKNSDPLSAGDLAVLRRWIADGAKWPTDSELTAPRVADLDWWSLRPLTRPRVPNMPNTHSSNRNTGQVAQAAPAGEWKPRTPIDSFIQSRLQQQGLSASQEADRLTLIRRLYFDLIGLPPTPEESAALVRDNREDAYERLVDRLLESKHYGEHWARHWLDVVHYADTHGYDKDKPRPNAWPYRDYVIRSLNADKPYERFVSEQIAGDALWPHSADGITATGFIAAGPWDFIGHAEVPESKIDGRIARHLDRDDMVASTMNTFCSITVQCARCHNHKFDPVTQQHYYSLQAVFAALDRADRPYDLNPRVAEQRAELNRRMVKLTASKTRLDNGVLQAAGERLTKIDAQLNALQKQQEATGGAKPQFGYHSRIAAKPDEVKWVQVDLGQPTAIETVVYVGCHDDFNGIGHGFGFPRRYKIESSNDAAFQSDVTVLADHTGVDAANPGTNPQSVTPPVGLKARYLRMTATRLAHRKEDYIFALAELIVMTPDGVNAASGKSVTSLDSIEAPVRWQRKNLVDGYYFGVARSPRVLDRIKHLRDDRKRLLDRVLSDDLKTELEVNRKAIQATSDSIRALPAQATVYAGTVHQGKGNFVGTGATGGQPRPVHVLHRGNIREPRELVGPGSIPVIANQDWRFRLPRNASESDRRVALARWLVHHDNPLTWRSIVNRVWQYHFGRGLVDSPNDFGRMGKTPSHPELLDWLAVEFRDGGQSLKKLHRLIVTSTVYRQSSANNEKNARDDKENKYLWRMNRRRLTAEELRDAVLAVSGKLDRTMYGPGFQLFVVERPEHSPHYEYDKHDPDDPKSHRRSIYRFIVRSQPDPFMTTLDCADSSQSVAKREETVTALQALSLLNNKFMLRMAEHFAERLRSERILSRPRRGTRGDASERVARAFELVTGHGPTDAQRQELADFAEEFGEENVCRLLFNLNEFMFVD